MSIYFRVFVNNILFKHTKYIYIVDTINIKVNKQNRNKYTRTSNFYITVRHEKAQQDDSINKHLEQTKKRQKYTVRGGDKYTILTNINFDINIYM